MTDSIYMYILVMAGVTYLIRMLPLVLLKKKIRSIWIRSFLHYVPFACLAAMTFPAILYGPNYLIGGIAGLIAALVLSFFNRDLVTVAFVACCAVFVAERLIDWIG